MPEKKQKAGTLYLIPAPLIPYSTESWEPARLLDTFPPNTLKILRRVTHYVVESEKSASRLLSRLQTPEHYSHTVFFPLDEHSSRTDLEAPLAALAQGVDCAILSEAGMPCIADPGGALVAAAHCANIHVLPVGSDSSILMALAASGLNGQSFSFLGYLPINGEMLRKQLSSEGAASLRDKGSRIFIETPYRNSKTMAECIAALPDELHLCFAGNLGTEAPIIVSKTVSMWKKYGITLPETPAVFCFGVPAALPRGEVKRRAPQSKRTRR